MIAKFWWKKQDIMWFEIVELNLHTPSFYRVFLSISQTIMNNVGSRSSRRVPEPISSTSSSSSSSSDSEGIKCVTYVLNCFILVKVHVKQIELCRRVRSNLKCQDVSFLNTLKYILKLRAWRMFLWVELVPQVIDRQDWRA